MDPPGPVLDRDLLVQTPRPASGARKEGSDPRLEEKTSERGRGVEPFWAELRSEAANQEQAVSAANKPGASAVIG